MKKLRVLALMHANLVPPDDVSGFDVTAVPWKMEFDVGYVVGHQFTQTIHAADTKFKTRTAEHVSDLTDQGNQLLGSTGIAVDQHALGHLQSSQLFGAQGLAIESTASAAFALPVSAAPWP